MIVIIRRCGGVSPHDVAVQYNHRKLAALIKQNNKSRIK